MSQARPLSSGWDVHQDAVAVASLAQEHGAEVISLGATGTRQCASDQPIRKRPSQATPLLLVYAAGPCGDWLSRYGTKQGDAGGGVAPSLVPQKAGDRVTTDRRDAVLRARLARSGDLPVVDVPTVAEEAIRDRPRARAAPLSPRQDATCRLKAFFLRDEIRDTGRPHGSPAPLRWRAAVVGPTPAHHLVLQAEGRAVSEPTARLQRLAQARQEPVPSWRVPPVVDTLQAWRGVPCPVAVTRVAAVGDRSRVDPPSALMPCLGVSPAASASGARRQQGALTQAGHTQARRALVAGAWAERDPAQVSRPLPRRLAQHPKALQDISWQAQVRRCQRDRRRGAKGQQAPVVTVALARAGVGFLWAMAKEVPVTPSGHKTDGLLPPHAAGVPTGSGSGAAPVRCHPRRRDEPPRASSRLA